jgi:hypothetical protein
MKTILGCLPRELFHSTPLPVEKAGRGPIQGPMTVTEEFFTRQAHSANGLC